MNKDAPTCDPKWKNMDPQYVAYIVDHLQII